MAPLPITFLSDYGNADEFAGVCRAVIAKIAPEATVIDLTHSIPRHDVARGAAALQRSLRYAPPGIHLAVVDPGVGTERRPLAVRVRADDRVLVGPDNGLLSPSISALGGAIEAVDLTRSPFLLAPVSETFHGRDIFAPVAAQLSNGVPISEAGDPIGSERLFKVAPPEPLVEPGRLVANVADIDTFGNVALEASGHDLRSVAGQAELAPPEGETQPQAQAGGDSPSAVGPRPVAAVAPPATIGIADSSHRATCGSAFADVPEGGLLLYIDSSNRVSLAVNRGNAARDLGLHPGDEVTVRLS